MSPDHFDKNVGGDSEIGGLKVNLNSDFINSDGSTDFNNTLTHEIGHTGGLIHPFDKDGEVSFIDKYLNFFSGREPRYDQTKGVDLKTNFMSYPRLYINYNTTSGAQQLSQTYLNPGHATSGQIEAIVKYYINGD